MSRFYVGQRVRLVRLVKFAHLNGAESRVKSIGGVWFDYRADSPCSPDGIELDMLVDGRPAILAADNLEPILPEGMQPVEWSECLWQPEGIAA